MNKVKMIKYVRTIFGIMDYTVTVRENKVKKYLKRGYQVCDENKTQFMTVLGMIRG